MTFTRVRPGGWAKFEVLTSSQMNNLDTNMTFALDGQAGGEYSPADGIKINNSFEADASAESSNTVGVKGTGAGTYAGVYGIGGDDGGSGVEGHGGATNGYGVEGIGAGTYPGVHGTGGASSGAGVVGVGGATNGHGVYGIATGVGRGVYGKAVEAAGFGVYGEGIGAGTGVYGIGGASSGAGVKGESTGGGNGVEGEATGAGVGVLGYTEVSGGVGVKGHADTGGVAIHAYNASEADNNVALRCSTNSAHGIPLQIVPQISGPNISTGTDGAIWYDSIGHHLNMMVEGTVKSFAFIGD